jgi:hypothetical protein
MSIGRRIAECKNLEGIAEFVRTALVWQSTGNRLNPRSSRFQSRLVKENARSGMAKPGPITLETVLALAKRLSAAEKLKLVEHLLVELEPIVDRKVPKKRRSPSGMPEGQSLTEEEVEEIKRKLWGNHGERRPKRVIHLKGLWKEVPFDISTDEIRQARQELSEALKRRAERH